jgi:hypothetical protein
MLAPEDFDVVSSDVMDLGSQLGHCRSILSSPNRPSSLLYAYSYA